VEKFTPEIVGEMGIFRRNYRGKFLINYFPGTFQGNFRKNGISTENNYRQQPRKQVSGKPRCHAY
jgi:hypothetical protein